jgi:small-conductance mechanosensitive channel
MRAVITKRQLGYGVVALGVLVALGTVGVDLAGAGQWSGFGPLQRIGVGLGVAGLAVGIVLIRLGDRPA